MAYKNFNKKRLKNILVCVMILIIASCGVEALVVVDEPATAKAGEVVTIKLEPELLYAWVDPGPSDLKNLLIAVLVPKGWRAATGTNTSMTYASDIGNGVFTKVPDSEKIPNSDYPGLSYPEYFKTVYGAGNNLFDDHEWVVFKSDKQYRLNNGQRVKPIITIKIKTGPENMSTKFGYVAGLSGGGLSVGSDDSKVVIQSKCFEVTDGTGEGVDFCTPPLASVSPLATSDKDFITLTYDNNLKINGLSGVTDIYLCAKAITTNDVEIDMCGTTAKKVKFTAVENGKFKLSVYPRDLFDVADGQTIKQIVYTVSNATGSVKVGKSAGAPFTYDFTICN